MDFMDFINKIKNFIIECRKDKDFKDDSDNELIKIFFKQTNLNIPINIQNLISSDHLFFEKIINDTNTNKEIYKWLKELSHEQTDDWEETEILLINNQSINKNIYNQPINENKQSIGLIDYFKYLLFGELYEETEYLLIQSNKNNQSIGLIDYFEYWLFDELI